MEYQLNLLKTTRQNALDLTQDLNTEQLNLIPTGFNNNLIWNLGHMVVTQQLLCYRLAGQRGHVSDDWIARYRKGSRPEEVVAQAEIEAIREALRTTSDQFMQDYEAGIFKTYNTYTTSYNATLSTVEEAFIFNNLHEAMHYGTMLTLKKLV